VEVVQKGLPTSILDHVAAAYGLTQQSFADLIEMPARTLQRRRAAGRFDAAESERLFRYVRLYQRAAEVFDDDGESARQFLTEPQPGLDGAIPIDFARSELGAAEVMDLLGRIDLGVYT
jgi:putative toxin-antitoxin system antitoxin component (TIGR02293 family)